MAVAESHHHTSQLGLESAGAGGPKIFERNYLHYLDGHPLEYLINFELGY